MARSPKCAPPSQAPPGCKVSPYGETLTYWRELIHWFNHRRLLEAIGNIPSAEAEDQYHAAADNIDMAA